MSKQALHKQKPPPDKLSVFINLVTMVPPSWDLPHPDEAGAKHWCDDPKCSTKEACDTKATEELDRFLKKVPVKLRRYVWQFNREEFGDPEPEWRISPYSGVGLLRLTNLEVIELDERVRLGTDPVIAYKEIKGEEPDDFIVDVLWDMKNTYSGNRWPPHYEAFRRYRDFWLNRQRLYLLAALAVTEPGQRERIIDIWNLWDEYSLPEGHVHVYVDSQEILRVNRDPFIESLDGVELARIRACEVCDRIFWAGRITMRCCGKKCGNVLRVRRWRERYYHIDEGENEEGYKIRRLRQEGLFSSTEQ